MNIKGQKVTGDKFSSSTKSTEKNKVPQKNIFVVTARFWIVVINIHFHDLNIKILIHTRDQNSGKFSAKFGKLQKTPRLSRKYVNVKNIKIIHFEN